MHENFFSARQLANWKFAKKHISEYLQIGEGLPEIVRGFLQKN